MSEAEAGRELGRRELAATYSGTAAFYDQIAQPFQEAAKLAAIAALDRRPGERFLEVAAGTGWLFSRVVRRSGSEGALGLELAAGMLDLARWRLAAEAGLAAPPLVRGDASYLPFADAAFDCLLSSYTLEVLPAGLVAPVLGELGRVLRPGGRLVLVNLTAGEGTDSAVSDDWARRYRRDPAAFGGARPVALADAVTTAGFVAGKRRYIGGSGRWPSEVLTARKPAAGLGPAMLNGCRTTHIFCRENCPSGRRTKPENRVRFANEAAALAAGYRACKVCRPDRFSGPWQPGQASSREGRAAGAAR